jgi:hypothetical protein
MDRSDCQPELGFVEPDARSVIGRCAEEIGAGGVKCGHAVRVQRLDLQEHGRSRVIGLNRQRRAIMLWPFRDHDHLHSTQPHGHNRNQEHDIPLPHDSTSL